MNPGNCFCFTETTLDNFAKCHRIHPRKPRLGLSATVTCSPKNCKDRSRLPQSPKNYFCCYYGLLGRGLADAEPSLFPKPTRWEAVLRNNTFFHPFITSYFFQRAVFQTLTGENWLDSSSQRSTFHRLQETRTKCSAHRCPEVAISP